LGWTQCFVFREHAVLTPGQAYKTDTRIDLMGQKWYSLASKTKCFLLNSQGTIDLVLGEQMFEVSACEAEKLAQVNSSGNIYQINDCMIALQMSRHLSLVEFVMKLENVLNTQNTQM